jgi:hypothetical protein
VKAGIFNSLVKGALSHGPLAGESGIFNSQGSQLVKAGVRFIHVLKNQMMICSAHVMQSIMMRW